MTTPPNEIEHRFDPVSLILGWLLPGLGYLWMGERRRGLLVMTGIGALVTIGVLVGGVDVVDRQEDGLWFLPQGLLGPMAFGLDWLNVTFVKSGTIGTQSIGRVNEIGTLYLALAGLLNLATMLDSATRPRVVGPSPESRRRRRDEPEFIERRATERTENDNATVGEVVDAGATTEPTELGEPNNPDDRTEAESSR